MCIRDSGYTPESVREEVIDYYVNQDLYDQAAKEYNAVSYTHLAARIVCPQAARGAWP